MLGLVGDLGGVLEVAVDHHAVARQAGGDKLSEQRVVADAAERRGKIRARGLVVGDVARQAVIPIVRPLIFIMAS